MSVDELKGRFKKFAIRVAKLIQQLPKNTINSAYCNQLIRSPVLLLQITVLRAGGNHRLILSISLKLLKKNLMNQFSFWK